MQYSGIKAEHEAVRDHAGLFDVSHMGEAVFRGPDAEEAVQRLVTRDVSRLAEGQAGYSAVCYESGGTVDDVIVYRRPEDFLVVVNASNREKDLEHFREQHATTSTWRSRTSRTTGRCWPCKAPRPPVSCRT